MQRPLIGDQGKQGAIIIAFGARVCVSPRSRLDACMHVYMCGCAYHTARPSACLPVQMVAPLSEYRGGSGDSDVASEHAARDPGDVGVIPMQVPDPVIEVPPDGAGAGGGAGGGAEGQAAGGADTRGGPGGPGRGKRGSGVRFAADAVGPAVSVYVPPPMPMPPKPAHEVYY